MKKAHKNDRVSMKKAFWKAKSEYIYSTNDLNILNINDCMQSFKRFPLPILWKTLDRKLQDCLPLQKVEK